MKVEILFPEVCNLYGDLQNVYYLRRCCPELEIVETGARYSARRSSRYSIRSHAAPVSTP